MKKTAKKKLPAVPATGPIPGPAALTKEWFELRPKVIGSSEAAQACGYSDYGTPLKLYLEKTGQKKPFAGNSHTKRGRRYEPLIKEDWEELTGRTVKRYPCPMFLHRDNQGVAATPDGEVSDTEGLEIKSSTWRMAKKLGPQFSDHIPNDWYFQAQQQAAVMGWAVVHFCVLVDLDPQIYRVDRNDDVINFMLSAEQELLERIRDRCPPEPTWHHPTTPQLLREMHKGCNDLRVMLSHRAIKDWLESEEIGKKITAMQKYRSELQSPAIHEIGENYAGLLGNTGEMVRRKWIVSPVKAHTKEYWSIISVKADGGPMAESADEIINAPPPEYELLEVIEMALRHHGYLLREESTAGSRYYSAIGKPDVRVSNHDPNRATQNWMDRNGVISLRTDLQSFGEELQKLENILATKESA